MNDLVSDDVSVESHPSGPPETPTGRPRNVDMPGELYGDDEDVEPEELLGPRERSR